MTEPTGNRPVREVRDGSIKIALFRNEGKDQGERVWYSGKLTRSYRDADGQWHETDYLSGTELLRAARLLERAYDASVELRSADRQDGTSPNFD